MTNETEKTQQEQDTRLMDLVSYLDGELPEEKADDIERQLASDSVMRSDVDILSRTWAMLDSLDEVSGSRQFTQSTLQVVAAETQSQPVSTKVRSIPLLKLLAQYHVLPLFLLGALAATAGLVIAEVTGSGPKSEEQAVDELVLQEFDLLKNVELYQRVPSADVLEDLDLGSLEVPVRESVTTSGSDGETP